ncbi:unnamed protein product, partial [Meganyctiphanes norvegica]
NTLILAMEDPDPIKSSLPQGEDQDSCHVPSNEAVENEGPVTSGNGEPAANENKVLVEAENKEDKGKRVILFSRSIHFQMLILRLLRILDTLKNFFGWAKKSVPPKFPILMGVVTFGLMVFDQTTDIFSTKQICTVQCNCVWKNKTNECEGPGDARRLGDECYAAFGNIDLIQDYCGYADNNASVCKGLNHWRPENFRHPGFCIFSAATIILPNFINSVYLIFSLWVIRSSVSEFTGIPNKVGIRILFVALFIVQAFPHTWVILSFAIKWHYIIRKKDIFEEYDTKWVIPEIRSKVIFNVLEDAPQLVFHSIFLVNSVITGERPLLDDGGATAYFGFISSTFSLALGLTLSKTYSCMKDRLIQFFTTFLSIGARALICASYATYPTSVINGLNKHLIYIFILPPVISICVFIVEDIFIQVFELFAKNDEKENGTEVETENDDNNPIGIVENGETTPEVNIENAENTRLAVVRKFKEFTRSPVVKKVKEYLKGLIFLTFEANSTQSIIPSISYLAFAVSLHAVWKLEENPIETEIIVLSATCLALTSYIFNFLIVLVDGKDRIHSLLHYMAYSLFVNLYITGMYIWIQKNFDSFILLFKATKLKKFGPEDIENVLTPLNIVFPFVVIIGSVNLLLIVMNIIKPRELQPKRKSMFAGDWLNPKNGKTL